MLYYQMWADLLQYLRLLSYDPSCARHRGIQGAKHDAIVLRKLSSVGSLQNLDLVFSMEDFCCTCQCAEAKPTVRAWQEGLKRLIQAMPRFSDPPVTFVPPVGGLINA